MYRTLVDGAIVAVQFVLGEVGLAGHAVQAAVRVEFYVAGVKAGLQQLLHPHAMAWLGGANEIVVGNVQALPCFLEEWRNGIGERLGRCASSVGSLLNLEAVFVGASEEIHIVAQQSVPASKRIANDGGVCMSQVWLCIHVINWRC